jgi:hypothetical protein
MLGGWDGFTEQDMETHMETFFMWLLIPMGDMVAQNWAQKKNH